MLWLIFCSMLLQAAPQVPAREAATPSKPGKAIIRGRVIDKDTSIPLARVQVQIAMQLATETPVQALTDEHGRYELRGVPAGSHRLAALPTSYRATHLAQLHGSDRPLEAYSTTGGKKIEVTDGEIREGIDFVLTRALAIEGRVVDEFGDPMAFVRVDVEDAAGRRLVFARGAMRETDDRGAYRVFGLSPGSYRVCADFRDSSPGDRGRHAEAPIRSCYPDDAAGPPVTITTSDAAGIEIRVRRSRTFSVSGIVVDSDGAPVEDAEVSLLAESPTGSSSWSVPRRPGGRFSQGGVVPGEYQVHARLGPRPGEPSARREVQVGYAKFRVDGADVTGLVVSLSKGSRISGRVIPEDLPLPPGTNLTVHATIDRSLARNTGFSASMATPAADLSFEIQNVFGATQFLVQGLPRGWTVKAVRSGGRDITWRDTEFPPGRVSTIEIVISSRGASLSGVVTDDTGAPINGDANIILLPVDEELTWRPESAPGGSVRGNGTFEMAGIRAGEYWVAAMDMGTLFSFTRTPDRARIVRVAERVVLGEGEKRTIDLRLVKLPEPR